MLAHVFKCSTWLIMLARLMGEHAQPCAILAHTLAGGTQMFFILVHFCINVRGALFFAAILDFTSL